MTIIAKSAKPLTWQRRARISNNPCVETLYDEPKSQDMVKTKSRLQTGWPGNESYSSTNPLVGRSSRSGGASFCAVARHLLYGYGTCVLELRYIDDQNNEAVTDGWVRVSLHNPCRAKDCLLVTNRYSGMALVFLSKLVYAPCVALSKVLIMSCSPDGKP